MGLKVSFICWVGKLYWEINTLLSSAFSWNVLIIRLILYTTIHRFAIKLPWSFVVAVLYQNSLCLYLSHSWYQPTLSFTVMSFFRCHSDNVYAMMLLLQPCLETCPQSQQLTLTFDLWQSWVCGSYIYIIYIPRYGDFQKHENTMLLVNISLCANYINIQVKHTYRLS